MATQALKRPVEPTADDTPQAKRQRIMPGPPPLPELVFSKELTGHQACVSTAKFSPDNTSDRTVRIWDAESGTLLKTLEGHTGGINDVAWASDNKTVASASDDKSIRLWDVNTQTSLELKGHTDFVFCVKFNKASTLLFSGSYDNTIKIWNVQDGKCLKTIPNAHADPVTSLDIGKGTKDSDEAFLVSASYDGKVCLRDANTGTCIKTLDDPGKAVGNVALSPNARYLLMSTLNNAIYLWDITSDIRAKDATPKRLKTYSGHKNEEFCLFGQFFADKWIISASEDQRIFLWSLSTPEQYTIIDSGHAAPLMGVTAAPNKKNIASFSRDGTIRLWKATLPTATPATKAAAKATNTALNRAANTATNTA